jgi:hypothetical protein
MRDDARYHLMASVHHAAKASAYGKLGYHDDQVRHAARALDHKLMFGAGDRLYDDIYADEPELGRLMRTAHGDLFPDEPKPPKKRELVVYTPADPYAPFDRFDRPVAVASVNVPPRVGALPRRDATRARRSRGPAAPLRVGPSPHWDATGQLLHSMRRVPVSSTLPQFSVGSDTRPRGPTVPHGPLHGVSVGVWIKPSDFFKADWEREKITRGLKGRHDLDYLNNGKQVTIHTPMPFYVTESIVETALKHRLREWKQFVETTQTAFERERDAPALD